jgi:hypothetical protein
MVGIFAPERDTPLVLKAKLDTGAKRSALHADRIEVSSGLVSGVISWRLNGQRHSWEFALPAVDRVDTRVSNFLCEPRWVVSLPVELAGRIIMTEFGLTNRSSFHHPCLLGRQYIQEACAVVDPNHKYLHRALPAYEAYAK